MTEKSAFLSKTSYLKPSIFDFVAQDSLNELLHPAVKRTVDVLSLRYPSFQNVFEWFDEYFLFGNFLLQAYYIKKYGGTFSETFYGLKRVSINGKTNSLSFKQMVLSVCVVCAIPYLKEKLRKEAETLIADEQAMQSNQAISSKAVIATNSGIHVVLQLFNFVQHLRFLNGNTDVNSPLLWAAGVKLSYVDDDQDMTGNDLCWRNVLGQVARRSLEVSAFFLQFYQWWQTEHVGRLGALPTPPPPMQVNKAISSSHDTCPLCSCKRHIDTAVSVSGYVFCFHCITKHLEHHHYCPVTKLPASIETLVRLYPPE